MSAVNVGHEGQWLIGQITQLSVVRPSGPHSINDLRALEAADKAFMSENIFHVMASWDRERVVMLTSRCAVALREAIEDHIRLFADRGFRELRRTFREQGLSLRADEYAHTFGRVTISTGASIPAIFANNITSYMEADVPAVLTGVVQAALTVIPGSGETRIWAPR